MKIRKCRKPDEEVLTKIHALKKEKGSIAVIEPETGDYFLGKTLTEALRKAKQGYPGRIFYSIRVGFPFAHEHKGGIRRL